MPPDSLTSFTAELPLARPRSFCLLFFRLFPSSISFDLIALLCSPHGAWFNYGRVHSSAMSASFLPTCCFLSLSRFRPYSTCSCFSFRPYIVPCCLPCRFWCNGARIDFDTDRYFQPTRLLLYASSIRHASYVFEYIAYLSSPRRPIINNKLLRTILSFVTRPIFD